VVSHIHAPAALPPVNGTVTVKYEPGWTHNSVRMPLW